MNKNDHIDVPPGLAISSNELPKHGDGTMEEIAEMLDHPVATTGAKREKLNVLPYDLVPYQEITDAYVRVAEHGAKKYDPWNWAKGLSRVQLIGSLLRHTFAYLRGQDRDSDSGLLHTDHILWNAVALVHNVAHDGPDERRPDLTYVDSP